jgi:hypothetical protein
MARYKYFSAHSATRDEKNRKKKHYQQATEAAYPKRILHLQQSCEKALDMLPE